MLKQQIVVPLGVMRPWTSVPSFPDLLGLPCQGALFFPVTVFWEEGGTLSAVQEAKLMQARESCDKR